MSPLKIRMTESKLENVSRIQEGIENNKSRDQNKSPGFMLNASKLNISETDHNESLLFRLPRTSKVVSSFEVEVEDKNEA